MYAERRVAYSNMLASLRSLGKLLDEQYVSAGPFRLRMCVYVCVCVCAHFGNLTFLFSICSRVDRREASSEKGSK